MNSHPYNVHKPGCTIYMSCLVIHPDGVCPGPYGICDCGADTLQLPVAEEKVSEQSKCGLCHEPMPPGEDMFQYHGYSGACPTPPAPKNNEFCLRCGADKGDKATCAIYGQSYPRHLYTPAPKQKEDLGGLDELVRDLTTIENRGVKSYVRRRITEWAKPLEAKAYERGLNLRREYNDPELLKELEKKAITTYKQGLEERIMKIETVRDSVNGELNCPCGSCESAREKLEEYRQNILNLLKDEQ